MNHYMDFLFIYLVCIYTARQKLHKTKYLNTEFTYLENKALNSAVINFFLFK